MHRSIVMVPCAKGAGTGVSARPDRAYHGPCEQIGASHDPDDLIGPVKRRHGSGESGRVGMWTRGAMSNRALNRGGP
jgi:hypothetical protein